MSFLFGPVKVDSGNESWCIVDLIENVMPYGENGAGIGSDSCYPALFLRVCGQFLLAASQTTVQCVYIKSESFAANGAIVGELFRRNE